MFAIYIEDDQPCFLPLSKYDYYLFILTLEKNIINVDATYNAYNER